MTVRESIDPDSDPDWGETKLRQNGHAPFIPIGLPFLLFVFA